MIEIKLELGGEGRLVEKDNEWGDKNTFSFPLSAETGWPYEIVAANLQGFFGQEGWVTQHSEDDGVAELYFLISGSFEVRINGEQESLAGPLPDLLEVEKNGKLVISNGLDSAVLKIQNTKGEQFDIPRVIIPPQTEHSSTLIPRNQQVCRFVAIKVRPNTDKYCPSN